LDTSSDAPHFPLNRFVLCPLDLTTRHALSLSTYAKRVDSQFKDSTAPSEEGTKPTIHHFTSSVLERTAEVMRGFGVDALMLHDPLAVWCAIANPPIKEDTGDGQPRMQKGWGCQSRIFDIERSVYDLFRMDVIAGMLNCPAGRVSSPGECSWLIAGCRAQEG